MNRINNNKIKNNNEMKKLSKVSGGATIEGTVIGHLNAIDNSTKVREDLRELSVEQSEKLSKLGVSLDIPVPIG